MKSITPQFYTVGVFAFINLILIVSVHAASQEAFISSTETPSFEQAVDDLMIEYNISSDSENNFKPKLWGILQFKHQEADLYTFFINLFELDQHKNILICDACPALLASVTYIKDKDKWTIKGINKEIAKTGSDDSFPEFEQSQYKTLLASI